MNVSFANDQASAAGAAEVSSVSVATEFPAPIENPAPASGFVATGTYRAPAPDPFAAAPGKGGAGYLAVKRIFDVLFSAGVCIVLAVPVALACVAIEVDSPGKSFFRQERIGKDGKRIYIFKLRTMVSDAHDHPEKYMTTEQLVQWQREQKVDKDPRITRVGRFLRRTSLDELPQFKRSKTLREHVIAINTVEEEADSVYIAAMRDLHTGCDDPMIVFTWHEIYTFLEYCVDSCEHVADTVDSIVMKNS